MQNPYSPLPHLPPSDTRPSNQSRQYYLKNSSSSYKKLQKFLITDATLTFIHKQNKPAQKLSQQKSFTPLISKPQDSTITFLPPLNPEDLIQKMHKNLKITPDSNFETKNAEFFKPLAKGKIYETQKFNLKLAEKFQVKKMSTLKNKIRQKLKIEPICLENEKICGWESNFP